MLQVELTFERGGDPLRKSFLDLSLVSKDCLAHVTTLTGSVYRFFVLEVHPQGAAAVITSLSKSELREPRVGWIAGVSSREEGKRFMLQSGERFEIECVIGSSTYAWTTSPIRKEGIALVAGADKERYSEALRRHQEALIHDRPNFSTTWWEAILESTSLADTARLMQFVSIFPREAGETLRFVLERAREQGALPETIRFLDCQRRLWGNAWLLSPPEAERFHQVVTETRSILHKGNS